MMGSVGRRVQVATSLARTTALVVVALCALGGVVELATDPVTLVWSRTRAGDPWTALPLDLLVEASAAGALACCAAWLGTSVLATAAEVMLEVVAGISLGVARAITPAVVRRVVVLCCGVAVGGSSLAAPALAQAERAGGAASAPSHPSPAPGPTRSTPAPGDGLLAGLPLPDRALGTAPRWSEPTRRPDLVPAAATTAPLRREQGRGSARHRVRPGESLWSITAQLLPHAAPSRIDAAWRLVHRANRRAIGPDPDVLIPGTTLRLPPGISSERADRPGDRGAADHRKDPS